MWILPRLHRPMFPALRQNGNPTIKGNQSCFGDAEMNSNITTISAAV